jgi:hypothetical protein
MEGKRCFFFWFCLRRATFSFPFPPQQQMHVKLRGQPWTARRVRCPFRFLERKGREKEIEKEKEWPRSGYCQLYLLGVVARQGSNNRHSSTHNNAREKISQSNVAGLLAHFYWQTVYIYIYPPFYDLQYILYVEGEDGSGKRNAVPVFARRHCIMPKLL